MCNIFGDSLVQGSAPDTAQYDQIYGLFLSISNFTLCAGKATAWNICYYNSTTDDEVVTSFRVYRPSLLWPMYDLVPGSASGFIVFPRSTEAYTCMNFNISESQQFDVQPGDILAACVFSNINMLGIVGSVSGASVLRARTSCTILPDSIGIYTGTVLDGYTLHINLGM